MRSSVWRGAVVAVLFCLFYPSNQFDWKDVERWTDRFKDNFNEMYRIMNVKGFSPRQNDKMSVQYFNDELAMRELERIVKAMKRLTQNKEKLVQNLREAAEDYYKGYDINQTISCSTYVYDRAKAITAEYNNETLNPTGEDKCQKKKYVLLEQSSLIYNMSVTFEKPTAHVPTNVYDGSKSILKVANWTENLDSNLKENLKNDPTLKFQYFASSNGMFKVFPGIMWHIQIDQVGESSPVDFFDCRSQTWYVEAATYPKDIVILVDKSGSMKGRRETIANLTVSEILSTLTENDFFNVLLFNESIYYADPIFTNILLQATLKNKERIMTRLNITPSGIADYAAGLRAAFELLRDSRLNSGYSSYCSKAIMIISDGAPDYYESLFEELNPDKDVRVFTYMIGQEASDRDNVRQMACNNRGFFVQIATLADVKENVQTYLPVMARTNALLRSRFTVWTGVHDTQIKGKMEVPKPPPPTEPPIPVSTAAPSYHDTIEDLPAPSPEPRRNFTEKKKKAKKRKQSPPLTIFTSVAQAVYDLKEDTLEKNFGNMIGVTGLDVPVAEFEKHVPAWKYGVNGYVFAINNNGYVLFHRNFRPIYEGKLRPFYQNVDIAEVEHPTDMTLVEGNANYNLQLRLSMIDRSTGTDEMEVFAIPDDFGSAYKKRMKYFFRPLNGTPFVIGLALPFNSLTPNPDRPQFKSAGYLRFKRTRLSGRGEHQTIFKKYSEDTYDMISSVPVTCERKGDRSNIVKIIPYPFCNFDAQLTRLFDLDPLCAFAKMMVDTRETREKFQCNEEFMAQIHEDAQDTATWNYVFSDTQINTEGLDGFNLNVWKSASRARLGIEQFFMMRYSGLIRIYNETMPSDVNFIENHLLGIRDTIFQTTVEFAALKRRDRKDSIYFHVPSPELVKRRLNDGKPFAIVATTVINIKDDLVPAGVMGVQITYEKFKELYFNITSKCSRGNCRSCSDPGVECYLITANAFVVASKRDEDIGKSLGEVDCEILNSMIDQKVFENQTLYDFQAVCTYPLMDASFANRLFDPITHLLGNLLWVVYNVGLLLANFFSATLWAVMAAAQDFTAYNNAPLSTAPNVSANRFPDGDPELIRKVEKQVDVCRNHTDEEEVMKCFQDFLNTLCRRVGADSNSDCITACKSLRKFSPDHWNAHEKCVYPSKPCSKEYTILQPTYLSDTDRDRYESSIPNCCRRGTPDRSWKARAIENSNLMLVVVSPARSICRCRCSPVFLRSQELTPVWSNTSQPYRKPPAWNCDTQRKENDSSCSNDGSQVISHKRLHLLAAFVVVYFIRNR